MGIDHWEWEGMGILIVFPHTSTTDNWRRFMASFYGPCGARERKKCYDDSETYELHA